MYLKLKRIVFDFKFYEIDLLLGLGFKSLITSHRATVYSRCLRFE